MARTQAHDYDQKRDTITAVAAALFAEKGFAGASVSDLAARCNMSKSLIYHYYPSKEAILHGVMKSHVDDLLEAVNEEVAALSETACPRERLCAMGRALMSAYAGAAAAQKVLLYEIGYLPKDQQSEIVTKERQLVDRFEKALAAAKPAFAQDATTLRAKVMLYFGMVNWSHTWFKPGGKLNRDQLSDMAVQTILGGA